jgi:CubicO group peptidase (beta-lactamase class C family)
VAQLSNRAYGCIQALEEKLLPAVLIKGRRQTSKLRDRLQHHCIPAVSVAVIHEGELDWAKTYGSETPGGKAVTSKSLFQSCSISKTIATATALRLVAAGQLELDRDVNEMLHSWQIPANPHTRDAPVTLRWLLSHRAGLNVGGFPGYEPGTLLPSLLQILRGETPSNTEAVRVEAQPGTAFRYSGGGTQVVQQLLEDVAGMPYARLAAREVLNPAQMTESTFAADPPLAVSGHYASCERLPGSYVIQPELAAAGLWSTPTDLVRFAMAIQRSYASHGFIRRDLAQEALKRTADGPTGLGFFLDGHGDQLRFSHSGGNSGFRCHMVAYASLGLGAVVMTNSDNGNPLISEVVNTIADCYAWPDFLVEREQIPLGADILERYSGTYAVRPDAGAPDFEIQIAAGDGVLAVRSPLGPGQLLPESETHFFGAEMPVEFEFKLEDGRAIGFKVSLGGAGMEGRRVEPQSS